MARAYDAIKALFIAGGLKDEFKEDSKYGAGEIYSPHSMRTFAENYMIRCGLPEKYVYAITSHTSKMGATTHYLDWDEIGKSWYETAADKMTWLQDVVRIIEKDPEVERIKQENAAIKRLLRELVNAQKIQMQPHEGHRPTEEVARLMELAKQLEDKKENDQE